MPQSLFRLCGHIVFSTKDRGPLLIDAVRPGAHAYIAGILRNMKCDAVNVGGTEDHVHVACVLSKFHAPAEVIEAVKRDSSKWMKSAEGGGPPDFHWQRGYGLFSVSPSDFDAAVAYVQRQEEHHRKLTFQEELRKFLKKYNVPYDERYVWD